MIFLPILMVIASINEVQPAMTSLTGVRDSYPRLSPDGRLLIFHSNRLGRQAIWIANADGSDPRPFFDNPAIGTNPSVPNWAADGRQLAFSMRPAGAAEGETEIYVVNADGSGLRRLTRSAGGDGHPHWSRSGRIYFSSARAGPRKADIYSMASDGSDVRRHTDCRGSCTYGVPSPDETYIVHRRAIDEDGPDWDGSPAKNSEIFVTPINGDPPRNVSRHRAFEGWPALSPDGKWIAFASTREASGPFYAQIYLVRSDGTGLRQVTSGPWSHIQPSFSPDGQWILVNEHQESSSFEVSHLAKVRVDLTER